MHLFVVVDVYVDCDLVDDLESVSQRLLEGLNDNDGVDVTLELGQGLCEDLSSCAILATATDSRVSESKYLI